MRQAGPGTRGPGPASEVLLRLLPDGRLRGPTARGRMGATPATPVTESHDHYVFPYIQPGGAVSCRSLGGRIGRHAGRHGQPIMGRDGHDVGVANSDADHVVDADGALVVGQAIGRHTPKRPQRPVDGQRDRRQCFVQSCEEAAGSSLSARGLRPRRRVHRRDRHLRGAPALRLKPPSSPGVATVRAGPCPKTSQRQPSPPSPTVTASGDAR